MNSSAGRPTSRGSRRITRRELGRVTAATGVAAAAEVLLGKAVKAKAGTAEASVDATNPSDIPVIPDIPPMSTVAQKYTDSIGMNNNFFRPDQSAWSQDQKDSYPQIELNDANRYDGIYLSAKNIADITGYTQTFDTIKKQRINERNFSVNKRYVSVVLDIPPWEYHDASDHPDKRFGRLFILQDYQQMDQ